MFLIEYKKGIFINAELIDWVSIAGGKIVFTIHCDGESTYDVDSDFCEIFVNNLQAINRNHNIESAYEKEKPND